MRDIFWFSSKFPVADCLFAQSGIFSFQQIQLLGQAQLNVLSFGDAHQSVDAFW